MVESVLILVTVSLLLFLLSMVWPPDSPWSPWWRTNGTRSRLVCKFLNLKSTDVIYDLGSGDSALLITAAKHFGARAVGIEIDPLRYFISRIMIMVNGVGKRVSVRRQNFFKSDIGDASVVFMYLIPKTLERLKPKLLKELKPGTRIVTFVYKIDLPIVKQDLKNEFYVYEIPKEIKVQRSKIKASNDNKY